MDNCNTIIFQVDGNDAVNGVDLDFFQDNYNYFLDNLASKVRRHIVSDPVKRNCRSYDEQLKKVFLLTSGE